MSNKPRKINKQASDYRRARNLIKMNLSQHVVIFTASLSRAYYVNRIKPGAKTHVTQTTQDLFDPDSRAYGKMRFDWVVYPVVVLKDAFGNIGKTHILDTEMRVQNATWVQATEYAIQEGNDFLGGFSHRFRANVGFVFVLDGITLTSDQILTHLKQDKDFFTVDESREVRTNEEIRADELKLIEALEKAS